MKRFWNALRFTASAVMVLLLCSLTALAAETTISGTANLDLENGSIVIKEDAGVTVFTQGDTVIRTTADAGIIRQTNYATSATTNTITVESGTVNLTLAGVNIHTTEKSSAPIELKKGSSAALILLSSNKLAATNNAAGLQVQEGASVTIDGTGSISSTGGYGRNGMSGEITINGGSVTADGGDPNTQSGGTGIRGTITINGGNVTAWGNYDGGAGISGKIIINDGEVTAKGGHRSGAGISGEVTITGGIVTAGGGYDKGTGISGEITISGGTVTANGVGGSAAISGSNITIGGGTVIATAQSRGAGIGGGSGNSAGNITISGGNVTAKGGLSGAGIGSGYYSSGGNITISGGTVTAIGGNGGAGIGGAYQGSAGKIIISGGTVTAIGGDDAAGIGGGEGGAGGTVSILNDAAVTVEGYRYAIGGGIGGIGCNSITISENATLNLSYRVSYGSLYQERIFDLTLPEVTAALPGSIPAITTKANGASGVTYQWQISNGYDGKWTDLPDETAMSLSKTSLNAETAGFYYRCTVTNRFGNVAYTDLCQAVLLSLSQQPTSVNVGKDELVSLQVVSSCPEVSYRWERSYDNGATWIVVPGEIYDLLIVNATLSENNALYRCILIADNGDELASESARITVESNAVSYTAQYYLQKADSSGYVLTDRITTESTAGTFVSAPPKTYEHFTENTAKGAVSGTVKADNSLTLSRYYDRVSYTISFDMNGGVSEKPITASYEANVTAPVNPTRAGYTFAGWYADAELTEEYVFSTMPGENITVYAKWTVIGEGRGIEYKITELSLLDGNYNPISSIPKGTFYVEVGVKNLSSTTMDTLALATYDEGGRFLGMQYLRSNPPIGYTFVLGTSLDNSSGDIAKIKAFVLPVLGGMVPLAESVELDG